MDTLFGIAVVGVWIAISVVGLKRAFTSHAEVIKRNRHNSR